jgi:DNA topoisomerase-1
VEIPDLKKGERLKLLEILPQQHFTEPPNRYSEASLVKALEEKGIGRPSTYATIVSTVQDRGYVAKEKGGMLRPTLLGFIATDFLKDYFPLTVAEDFTAHMEEELDKISNGELTRVQVLKEFYEPLSQRLDQVKNELSQENPSFHITTDVSCPNCGAPMEVRFWKGTAFLGCSRYPDCKQTVNFPQKIEYVYRGKKLHISQQLKTYQQEKREMESTVQGRSCPTCGAPLELREGKFGRFYGCSRYPDCKTTLPVSTGVPCPLCGRDLVERYARKSRKPFYGCEGYPDCKFAVNERPVRVCSACSEGVLVQREADSGESVLTCSNKKCGHREAVEPSVAAASPQSSSP